MTDREASKKAGAARPCAEELLAKARKPGEDSIRMHAKYRGKIETGLRCPVRSIMHFTLKQNRMSRPDLDIFRLKGDSLEDSASLPEPHLLAAEIAEDLEVALEQIREVAADLEARAARSAGNEEP